MEKIRLFIILRQIFALSLLACFCGIYGPTLTSCKAQRAFIQKDSLVEYGIKMPGAPRHSNSVRIEIKNQLGQKRTYSPNDLKAYRIDDKTLYISASIEEGGVQQRYFFERLYAGQHYLFYLKLEGQKERFFITGSDTTNLQEIPQEKTAAKAFLSEWLGSCERSLQQISIVAFNHSQLRQLLEDYESCADRTIPRLRFGVNLGNNTSHIRANSEELVLSNAPFRWHSSLFASINLSIPLGTTNISLQFAPDWRRVEEQFSFLYQQAPYDLILKHQRFKVPVLARYTWHKGKHHPFLEAGPTYSYVFDSRSDLFEYRTQGSDFQLFVDDNSLIQPHQVGYTLGLGFMLWYERIISPTIAIGFSETYQLSALYSDVRTQEAFFSLGIQF
ncbi:MAG: outer membrane beta-barrel protein [Bacteroidota bacterium]